MRRWHVAINGRPWTSLKQGQLVGASFCMLVFAGMALTLAVPGDDGGPGGPAGSGICVLTDKDHVAAVHVIKIGAGVVVAFEVWG